MDRLSAMALLVKVAELGSMSAAARALNMPLTTVSRQVGELENTLGVRLMIRTTRKLTLTDAGVDYVAAARRILEEVENAERRAAGEYQEPKGELVLSAPTMFGRQHVLPVVTDFLARYPQIRVRLLLSDRNADLVGDHIDLAVRIGTLPDSGMVATRLGEMRIVTCAHPALLEKHGIPERPRELAALPIIRIESPMPYRGWRFNAEEAEDRLVALQPVLSLTTPESAADAARLGAGVARLLPEGAQLPRALNPAAVQNLPAEIRLDYLDAFGSAIHAAFLMAACIMAAAFALSWLLKEAPLKTSAR